MRAFILRRVELIAAGVGDIILIGSTHSASTLRIKEFLMRNGHPYSYIDLEHDPDVQNLVNSFQFSASEIYQHKGKVIGQRVLGNASEKGQVVVLPKIETTFSADAKLKGTIDITDIGTYLSIIRPGGILHGEGQGLYMTKDGSGETATWTGQGVGRLTEGGRVSYRGSLFFRANSTGKLSFLNNIVTVFEYEVDESGNTTAKMWEWK